MSSCYSVVPSWLIFCCSGCWYTSGQRCSHSPSFQASSFSLVPSVIVLSISRWPPNSFMISLLLQWLLVCLQAMLQSQPFIPSFVFLPHGPAVTNLLVCLYYYIDRFYIALFSALEQTHCARMWFYMSDKLFIARFWISTEVVYLQRWHGWCHKNLLPERVSLGAFCVHHTTMHRVTSCKATYVRCMRV